MSEIAHNTASSTSVVHMPASPQVMATRNRTKHEYKETYHVQPFSNIHNNNNINNTITNFNNNSNNNSIVDKSKANTVELVLSRQGNKSRESNSVKYNALLQNVKVNHTDSNIICTSSNCNNGNNGNNKYNSKLQALPSLTLTSSSVHATPKQTFLTRLSNSSNNNSISSNNVKSNKIKNTFRTNQTKKMNKTKEETMDKKNPTIVHQSPSTSSTLSTKCIEPENTNNNTTTEEQKSKEVLLESTTSSETPILAPHKPTLVTSLHLELREEQKSKTDHNKQKQKMEKRKTKISKAEKSKESGYDDNNNDEEEKECSKHARHLSYLRSHQRNIPMMVNRLYRSVLAARPAEPIQFIISALENNEHEQQQEEEQALHSVTPINEETKPKVTSECKKVELKEIDKETVITRGQDVDNENEEGNKCSNVKNALVKPEDSDQESDVEANKCEENKVETESDDLDVVMATNDITKEGLNHSQRPPRSPAMWSTISSIQRNLSTTILSSSHSTCTGVKNVNESSTQLLMPSLEVISPKIQPPLPPPPALPPSSSSSTHSTSPSATPQATALLNSSLRALQTSLINHNTTGIGKTTTTSTSSTANAWSVDEVFAHSNRSTFSTASSVSNLSCSISSTNSTMMTGSMLSTDVEEFLNELRALKREVIDAHGHHLHRTANINENRDEDDEEWYDEDDDVDSNELLTSPHSRKNSNSLITISQLARIIESASFPLPELSLLSDLFDELCSTTPSALVQKLSSSAQTGVTKPQQTEVEDNNENSNNNRVNNTQKDVMTFYKRAAQATWNTQTGTWDGSTVTGIHKEEKNSNNYNNNVQQQKELLNGSNEAVVNFETFLARMALAIQGHYPADIVRRAFFSLSFPEKENHEDVNMDVNEHNGSNREEVHSPFPFHEAATRRVVSSADESDTINHNACDKIEFGIHNSINNNNNSSSSSNSNNNSRCNSRESDLSNESGNGGESCNNIGKIKRRRKTNNGNQTSSGNENHEIRAFSANSQQSTVANKLYSLTSAALLLYKNSNRHSPLLTHLSNSQHNVHNTGHIISNDKPTFPMFSELNRSVPLRTCVLGGLVRTLGMVKLTEVQLYKALHMIGIKTHNSINNSNINSTGNTNENTNKCNVDNLSSECNADTIKLYLNDFIALVQVLSGNTCMSSNVNSPNSVFINSMCAKSPSLNTSLRGSPWLGNSGSTHLASSLLLRNARVNNNVIANNNNQGAISSSNTSNINNIKGVNNTTTNTYTTRPNEKTSQVHEEVQMQHEESELIRSPLIIQRHVTCTSGAKK